MNFFETALVENQRLVRESYHIKRIRETFDFLKVQAIIDGLPLEYWQQIILYPTLHHWQDKAVRIDFIHHEGKWTSNFTPRTPRQIVAPLRMKVERVELINTKERNFKWEQWQRQMSANYPLTNNYDEVLFVDQNDYVLETLRANFYLKNEELLITPPLELGLLKGTYRQWLIDQGKVSERPILLKEITPSDSLYLSNALIGLVPAIIVS